MKILILKPSSLGDVIQALPVLRLLKRHLPQSEIYWWIDPGLAPLLEGDPDLAGLILFHRKRWAAPSHWVELWSTVRWMRSQSFDWVIDLQGLARSGVFAWLANGALTVGLDDRREQAQLFYDLIGPRLSHEYHAVDWYLSVLPLLGLPAEGEFEWFPPRPLAAAAVRQKWPIEDKRWIIFQPGARWLNKRWPVEYFAELARLMAASYPECRFAILGGADDRSLGEVISSAVPGKCLDLTGKLSLPEMVEWIRLSEMMVSNDTGPMHVAAALEKLVVALMGPTEPRRTGPYNQTRHVLQINLPCVPCFKSHCTYVKPLECLRALTPAMVFASVRERLRS